MHLYPRLFQFWEDPLIASNKDCQKCQLGYYQPTAGGLHCLTCDWGKYTDRHGSKSCEKVCPAGSKTNRVTVADGCEVCPRGSYAPEKGLYNCIGCEPGSRAKNVGSVKCEPCPRNWFMNHRGQYRCAACAPNCKSAPGSTKCYGKLCYTWVNTYSPEPVTGKQEDDWKYSYAPGKQYVSCNNDCILCKAWNTKYFVYVMYQYILYVCSLLLEAHQRQKDRCD